MMLPRDEDGHVVDPVEELDDELAFPAEPVSGDDPRREALIAQAIADLS